jgi:hypothetical protein
VAHRDVKCGVTGIGIGYEGVSAHNQEDKEPGVTVSGSALRLGTRPICGEPASLKAR